MAILLLLALAASRPLPAAPGETPPYCRGADFVPFDSGSTRLLPDARLVLDGFLHLLGRSRFRSRVEVTGYADSVGSAEANLRLSRRRAEAIKDYLAARGFPRRRIVARAVGETEPLVVAPDDTAERRNRFAYLFEYLAPAEQARREAIWARVGRPKPVC